MEVHFRLSSGNRCPWTNRRLQEWLEEEIRTVIRVEEGFNVPSTRFALVMQLSHIQWHFLYSGIGMRQICDYYWLLRNSTEEERKEVSGKQGRFGLKQHGKIWKFEKYYVYLPTVTTNHWCIWMPVIYEVYCRK